MVLVDGFEGIYSRLYLVGVRERQADILTEKEAEGWRNEACGAGDGSTWGKDQNTQAAHNYIYALH